MSRFAHAGIQGLTKMQLADGCRPFMRTADVIQFGSDATRTGMISTPAAAKLLPLLESLERPKQMRGVVEMFARAVGESAAQSFVADLVSYRILVPVRQRRVLILGNCELSRHLREQLDAAGVEHRSPVRGESLGKFLLSNDPWMPLAIVNAPLKLAELAIEAKHRRGLILPVQQLDARVTVGPVCGVGGPCLMCVHLHHMDRDPNWEKIAARVPFGGPADPAALGAGAAASAVVLRRLVGLPDPPGVSAPEPRPGTVTVVDPFGPEPVARAQVPQHPDCPLCF